MELLPGAGLFGQRALLVPPTGEVVSQFDSLALPRVRLPTRGPGHTGPWSLRLVVGERVHLSPLQAERRGEWTLLRVAQDPRPWPPAPERSSSAQSDGLAANARLDLLSQPPAETPRVAARWPVRWERPPSELPGVAQLVAARRAGPAARASATIQGALPSLEPYVRVWALIELARVHLGADELEQAVTAWQTAADAAQRAGLPTQGTRCRRAAAFALYRARRFAPAEELLDVAAEQDHKRGNLLGVLRADHYRGMIATQLGDFRRAVGLLEGSAALAWSIGADDDHRLTSEMLALLLSDQGQHARALALLEGLPAPATSGQQLRARYDNNLGWVLLRGMQSGALPPDWPRASAHLRRALRSFDAAPRRAANVVANLAVLELLAGDRSEARRLVEQARKLDPAARGPARVFVELLGAELLLPERPPQAEAVARRSLSLALDESGGAETDLVWRTGLALGRALRAQGRPQAALSALRQAQAGLAAVGRRTQLTRARAPFHSDRRDLVTELLDLLTERQQLDEAFAVADASQARVVHSLHAQTRVGRLDASGRAEWGRRLAAYLRLRARFDASLSSAELLVGDARRAWQRRHRSLQVELLEQLDALYAWLEGAVGGPPGPAPTAPPVAPVPPAHAPLPARSRARRTRRRWRGWRGGARAPGGPDLVRVHLDGPALVLAAGRSAAGAWGAASGGPALSSEESAHGRRAPLRRPWRRGGCAPAGLPRAVTRPASPRRRHGQLCALRGAPAAASLAAFGPAGGGGGPRP